MLDNNDKQEEDEMIPFFNIASTDFKFIHTLNQIVTWATTTSEM
jgi:hypothetical protein